MVEMAENECVLSDTELTAAIEMLRAIIPDEELELLAPTGPATVYTTSITIWMLILQRLGKGRADNEVVKDVLSNSRKLPPDNKRVREMTLSKNPEPAASCAKSFRPPSISTENCSMVREPPNSAGQAFSRGIRLKCPMCSEGRLFEGFIHMQKNCSVCEFHFERGPGYFLGSTYINYGVTTLLTTWTYMVLRLGFEVSKSVLIPTVATFCLIFPVLFFRYARSLWLSFDCYLDRTGAMESVSEREISSDE